MFDIWLSVLGKKDLIQTRGESWDDGSDASYLKYLTQHCWHKHWYQPFVIYPSISPSIKRFGDDTVILQENNNNVWNVAIYAINKVSELYGLYCLKIGSIILGCPDAKYTLICVRTSNHTYRRENKKLLENTVDLNKRHFWQEFSREKMLHIQYFFSKKCEFEFLQQ